MLSLAAWALPHRSALRVLRRAPLPRALVQALRIEKGEEWVLEGGELVLKRLGKLKK